MIVYQYDKSFDGLLTCIFEAYDRKMFPDILQAEGVLRPAYPLSPLAGCPNFRIPTAYYSVISAKLSTLSARSKSTSEIPMYSKPLRSLRKWGTNVYGLSNSPVFKKPSTELILPPSNRYTMYCLWLSVTFKTDSPTNAGCCMISNGNTVIITIGKKSMKSVSKPKEPIF